MKFRTIVSSVFCLALLGPAGAAQAEVRLAKIFGDHMVLQQQMPVPVWGWAPAGEEVTVELAGHKATGRADDTGRWQVTLDPLEAGGPHEMTITGSQTISVKDILVGEVWICSGQSNMAWTVSHADRAAEEIAAADHPRLRHFQVAQRIAESPAADVQGKWDVASPATAAGFTAVGYFFGRHLLEELDVPIGLVNTSWGGTPAEAWTSRGGLQADEDLKAFVAHSAKFSPKNPHQPSVLFNGMVSPLVPLAMRGVIWYQGESNVGRAQQYARLFPAMITDWRASWGRGDFPFLYVQLAPFRYGRNDPAACAELWEAQLKTLALPQTGMAVTVDIGNPQDIHPKNKQDVGRRLALWALAGTYGRSLVYSGPLYEKFAVEGNKIRVHFRHVGSGLVARGGELTHFTIAGADGRFLAAQARIDGETVVVESPEVPEPVAVRYAWRDDAQANLFNQEGLPASPFRTDDFPPVTAAKR